MKNDQKRYEKLKAEYGILITKKVILKPRYVERYPEDCKRIQSLLSTKLHTPDLDTCAGIWCEYSDTYAEGWLGLPESDTELYNILKNWI